MPEQTEEPRVCLPLLEPGARALLARLEHPVWVFDIERARVRWANAAALAVWRADGPEELYARDMAADMSDSVRQRLHQFHEDFQRHDARFSEIWTLYPRGVPRTLRVMYSGVRLEDGRAAMLCEGIGEQHADPETLRSAEALLHTSMMISLYGGDGQLLYRNPAARAAAPQAAARLEQHFANAEDHQRLLGDLHRTGSAFLVCRVHTSHGASWHRISARRCLDAVSGDPAWLLSAVDVSDIKRAEEFASHQAQHDRLTGLPNRHFISESFPQRLLDLQARGLDAALLFIDLDRFKTVNDSLGHAAGDELLVEMAARLRDTVRQGDLLARLGGDEFLVLAAHTRVDAAVQALGRRLLQATARPLHLRGHELSLTPSIGVALFPRDGQDIDTLMRHADLAMYAAKDGGRNRVVFFSATMQTQAQTRLSLEQELRRALDHGEFILHYQPRHRLRDGRIVGVEALVRWQHPGRGLVLPLTFIPLCEETGLIHRLGAQVLELATQQLRQWQQAGRTLSVSVNLSPRQFDDAGFMDRLADLLAHSGCDASALELEITESVLLGHDERTLERLHALRELGCGLAVDDFGTGYSNLAYLPRVPLTCMKVDRSFISQLPATSALTRMIVSLGHALGLRVVAEGVETEAQHRWLAEIGCDEFQGFLRSRPMPAEALEPLLQSAAPARRAGPGRPASAPLAPEQ